MTRGKRRLPAWIRWPLAILIGLVLAILAAEIFLRYWAPTKVGLGARQQAYGPGFLLNPARGLFDLDDELGYRPVLGTDLYGKHGARCNNYSLEKPAGVRRLLFLGDSATFRGAFVDGFRKVFGEQRFEYWNAGIEGYATQQEATYYERYCGTIDADHLLLTFHLNDFKTTPVTFMHGDEMIFVQSKDSRRTISSTLLRWSYLYRFYLGLGLGSKRSSIPTPEVMKEVEDGLCRLKRLTKERGAEFTVLVLPCLRPLEKWGPLRRRHDRVIHLLDDLGIRHFQLIDVLQSALAQGIEVRERPPDPAHPSAAFGLLVARHLQKIGFKP